MSHPWIDAFGHIGPEVSHDFGAFAHAFHGDVSVHVAAAKKNRSRFERSLVFPRRPGRANQTAAKTDHRGVTAGVARP
jgi:hypothetical protein